MRNKNLAINKLEILEGNMKTLLHLATSGQDIDSYNNEIQKSSDLIQDLKSMIDREPDTN